MSTPEEMEIICNIQGMKAIINENYDPIQDFKNLEKKSFDELWDIQCDLIPHYNKAIKERRALNTK